MATFALVHGGWHAAWCWERLTPLVQQHGHDVVAVDLPGEDGSASFDTYADVVRASLDGCDDDVVVVGHSYGRLHDSVGRGASAGAALGVCVCPCSRDRPERLDQLRDEPGMVNPGWDKGLARSDELVTEWVDRAHARAVMFADCDDATAEAAIDRLRPQSTHPNNAPFGLAEFPAVSCTSVVCSDDQMVGLEWAKRIARERLGAELIELPGSHSPFLSRPSALGDVLLNLAD
jgi:pimeloyl-ACP methyl ester carboxylesterase